MYDMRPHTADCGLYGGMHLTCTCGATYNLRKVPRPTPTGWKPRPKRQYRRRHGGD